MLKGSKPRSFDHKNTDCYVIVLVLPIYRICYPAGAAWFLHNKGDNSEIFYACLVEV